MEAVLERIERKLGSIDNIEKKLESMDNKLSKITQDMAIMKEENNELKKMLEIQDKRIGWLEREARKNNIVVKGVPEEENEKEYDTNEKIQTVMKKIGVSLDEKHEVEEIRRIGKFCGKTTRPIVIKLNKQKKKTEILSNAKLLKGTDVWIDMDYPKEVQDERRKLIPQLKEARRRGYRAYLNYDKLVVNNEVYSGNQVDQDMEDKNEVENLGSQGTSTKRTTSERSPKQDDTAERRSKITKTTNQKN